MSINEKNTAQSAQPDPRRSAPQATGFQDGETWSFQGLGGMIESPIPAGLGDELYNKVFEKLTEVYKSADKGYDIQLVRLDRASDPSLNFSCILVCTQLRASPRTGWAMHILLLARTGEEIPVLAQQYGDRSINVYRVPGDAINAILVDKARQAVLRQVGPGDIINVDGTVLGPLFDPENKAQVHGIARTAAGAGVTELNRRLTTFRDLNLANLTKNTGSQVEITFNRQTLEDSAGNPFRSDVQTVFTNRKGGQVDQQLNSGSAAATFSRLSSFQDVVWYPGEQAGFFSSPFGQQQPFSYRKYVAREVITAIDNTSLLTPGAVVLGLSTILALRNPQNWIQGFRPLHTRPNIVDLTDIGALNIEANIPVRQDDGTTAPDPSGYGRPIATKDDAFKLEQLGQYVNMIFHPELMIALDVPEYGPQTWYLSMFAAAASGVRPAMDAIIGAANTLTNGEFAKHFNPADPLFLDQGERIHAGYWKDVSDQKLDLRAWDHTAVANQMGARNPSYIREWSDSFLRRDIPEVQRLATRRAMLVELCNGTAVFTGYHRRLHFSRAFLKALDDSIRLLLPNVGVRTPLSGQDIYSQRGTATWAAEGMIGGASSAYSGTGGFGSAPTNFMPGYTGQGRW